MQVGASKSESKNIERHFRVMLIQRLALLIGGALLLTVCVRWWFTDFKASQLWGSALIGSGLIGVVILARHPKMERLSAYAFLFWVCAAPVNAGLNNGGMRAPAMATFLFVPLFGFLVAGTRGARFGSIISVLSLLGLLAVDEMVLPLDSPQLFIYYKAFMIAVGIGVAYLIGSFFERSRRDSEKKVYELSSQMLYSAKLTSLAEMSAGLAHEINNPLTILKLKISQLSRSLGKGEFDAEATKRELAKVHTSLNRIESIVRGLKVFSGAEDGTTASTSRSVMELLREVLGLTREKMALMGVEWQINGASDLEAECRYVDIMQAFFNLLTNSLEAIQDLPEKWVRIDLKETNGVIEVSFVDSGSGIPEEVAKNLMQPFHTTKPPGKGVGLGLSIAKGVFESHGGSLRYDPASRNTRFVVTLPKSRAHSSASWNKAS